MKILVAALYVSGNPGEGGSSRLMRCVIDTLEAMGHEVVASTTPGTKRGERYDLIICSHLLDAAKGNPARKVCIAHGVVREEWFQPGADRYISISKEIHESNLTRGFESEVIGQPIRINGRKSPGRELRKILVIRRYKADPDPFAFLSGKYELRYSTYTSPIEAQIDWADLCITLGRGALESMARGKPVLVADNRKYIGKVGDGYVTRGSIGEIAECNFSGRKYRHPITDEWVEGELGKYDPEDSFWLHEYVVDNHEAGMIVQRYL
jgi:hypothetical protein